MVIVLGTIALGSGVSGLGGLLVVCHPSAFIPANFHSYGNCHATDTPKEVFGSFAILGLILCGLLLAVITLARALWHKVAPK